MDKKVSVSETGQNEPPPDREARDAASSSGGGRKAAEQKKDNLQQDAEQKLEPPIGLDVETRGDADEEYSEALYEDPQADEYARERGAKFPEDTDEMSNEQSRGSDPV